MTFSVLSDVRCKKTGKLYRITDIAMMQHSQGDRSLDNKLVYVYRAYDSGRTWVREQEEFDERFESV